MSDATALRMRSVTGKLALLRERALRSQSPVVIELDAEPAAPPALPGGVADVFAAVRSVGGDLLRFERPAVIASQERWDGRARGEGGPLGDAAVFGFLRFSFPQFSHLAQWEDAVYVDLLDGSVFYCSCDEYAFAHEHPGEVPETVPLAANVIEFFDDVVLGGRYPDLVRIAVGAHYRLVVDEPAEVPDAWLRLLREAGLA